jgi:hypothetical protein
METKEYILMQFEILKSGVDRTITGLTQQEISWRPSCGCNPIGLIFFHVIKIEDSSFQSLQGKNALWETEKWYVKLNLPVTERGSHYTSIEQINNFQVPRLEDLLAYSNAVRIKTLEYINNVSVNELERKIKVPWRTGEFPIAWFIASQLSHITQHIGEISYLRGLQRGMDK